MGSVALADYDFVGYEYGTSYWGYPVTGPCVCVITTAMGILLDYFYEKQTLYGFRHLGMVQSMPLREYRHSS